MWNNRRPSSNLSQQPVQIHDDQQVEEDVKEEESLVADLGSNELELSAAEEASSEKADADKGQALAHERIEDPSQAENENDLVESSATAGSLPEPRDSNGEENRATIDPAPMTDLFGEVFGPAGSDKDDRQQQPGDCSFEWCKNKRGFDCAFLGDLTFARYVAFLLRQIICGTLILLQT